MRPIDPEIIANRARLDADLEAAREARKVPASRWILRLMLLCIVLTAAATLFHH